MLPCAAPPRSRRVLLLALFGLLTLFGGGSLAAGLVSPAWAEARGPAVLRLLHVNDIYDVSPNAAGVGGLAELKTLVASELRRPGADQSVVTFGGDLISPSYFSSLDHGAPMLTLLGKVGVEMAVPGNHEFDFGAEVFARHLQHSPFLWLACNVLGADGQPFGGMQATAWRTVGPYKVAFLGVLTEETPSLSSPGEAVRFVPALEAVRKTADALKAQGADVIVALTHLDMAQDRRLLEQVPAVDVALGGHDHDVQVWSDQGRVILKAGADGVALGVVSLTIQERDTQAGPRISTRPEIHLVPNVGQAPDPELEARIAGWKKTQDDALAEPLGTLVAPLDSRRATVRGAESSLGSLIADAVRAQTKADVALVNGGGIRGDRLYEVGAVLTARDVMTELPFGNKTVVLKMTGAVLLKALEHGVSAVEQGAGRFLQVSGLRLTWDPKRPSGERVIAVKVGEQDLDPVRHYTVATADFTARGGDGFTMLGDALVVIGPNDGRLMTTQVVDYIKGLKGTVAAGVEGRIRQVP